MSQHRIEITRAAALAAGLFALAASAACAAPTQDGLDATSTTSADVTGVRWQAAYWCDGATLDVNMDERRDVQFVIRDQDAIDDFKHGVDTAGYPMTVNAKGELIFSGHVDKGIFYAHDFSSAQVKNGDSLQGVIVSARDYPGGIGNGGSGDPSDIEIWFGEYTNWRFRHCNAGF